MKKIYTLLTVLVITASVFAQVPQKMSYQAILRDADNQLLSDQAVGMQISILQGSVTGTAVYVETHYVTTNNNGLVSLDIGTGTVLTGVFETINWGDASYFIKTETDPTGGTAYTITGTSQFMSVPYALHAKTALNITGGIPETDPVFGFSVAAGITATDTANWNNHTVDTHIDSTGIAVFGYVAGPHTMDTDTHIDSTGVAAFGYVAGPHTVDTDTHIDSTGIAVFGYVAGSHTVDTDTHIDSTGVAAFGYVAGPHTMDTDTHIDSIGIAVFGYVAGPHTVEVDGDVTNELQTISRSGTTVTLSDGGGNFELNTYTAGSGINITNNSISAIPYTAGTGISISGNTISATSTSNVTFYKNDQSYWSQWQPLITYNDGTGYNGRVTLSYYETTEGNLHVMGNGSPAPPPMTWSFYATIDGYAQVMIRIEYTDGTTHETDVILCKLADALTTIASVGGLDFRYNSTSLGGYIEVLKPSSNYHCQVYCTKTTYY